MKKQSTKKIISKMITAFCLAVLFCCVFVLISVTVSLSRTGVAQLFGYSFHVVVTDSMSPEINVKDLVIAKKSDVSTIGVGDDIVFVSADPVLKGSKMVHRVVDIKVDGSFITSGIKEGATSDAYSVAQPIGKVVAVNASLGKIVSFLIQYRGIMFIVLLAVVVVIAFIETFNIVFTLKLKKQVEQEIKEEAFKELNK